MIRIRLLSVFLLFVHWLVTSLVVAQNPKPPTPTFGPPPIVNAVTLWVDGQNLTVYVDSTVNPADDHKLTALWMKWDGPGPGFVVDNCDFENIFNGDVDVCRSDTIAKFSTRGFGPVYDLGNIIPEGYLDTWSPADAWIVDGAYLTGTLDVMDRNSPYFGPFIPEPSSLTLLCLGLLTLRRRF